MPYMSQVIFLHMQQSLIKVIYDTVVEQLIARTIVYDEVNVGATLTAPYIRSTISVTVI